MLLSNENEVKRAKKLGITDLNKKYNIADMINGDVMFCATGVTDGDMVKGININNNTFEASTFILHKSQKIYKKIKNIKKNEYKFCFR